MEKENLTYRKCCTTPFPPDRQWFLVHCEASVSSLRRSLVMFLSIQCPSLPSNVDILVSLQNELGLRIVVLCEFGTDRAWGMEALLRERRKGRFFMCLPGEKSEDGYAQKTCSSMCRRRMEWP